MAWADGLDIAASEDRKREFWELAVRKFAASCAHQVPVPCVVLCHVTAPPRGQKVGGPRGRAKTLLDALHDDRKAGPKYRELAARAPLMDDKPSHVRGLAVEVATGAARTDYFIGEGLAVNGELLASIPVAIAAPNDIAGTPEETPRIRAACRIYGEAVRDGFLSHRLGTFPAPQGVVVRHHPQRDEDNTWATWTTALCGSRRGTDEHWAAHAPMRGWEPTSIASVADPSLKTPVVYEFWG